MMVSLVDNIRGFLSILYVNYYDIDMSLYRQFEGIYKIGILENLVELTQCLYIISITNIIP